MQNLENGELSYAACSLTTQAADTSCCNQGAHCLSEIYYSYLLQKLVTKSKRRVEALRIYLKTKKQIQKQHSH